MRVIFYLPTNVINDATSYYIDLFKRAFCNQGIETISVNNKGFSPLENDFIYVIRVRDFTEMYLKHRKSKIIFWAQGIGPEEFLMINNYAFWSHIVCFWYSRFEKFCLKKSFHNVLVSKKMKVHFEKKYSLNLSSSTIIPCYNKHIKKSYFNKEIKKKSSYVFAGSLFAWQCFEKTVKVFSEIEKHDSSASLTVLTKDVDTARTIMERLGVKKFDAYYVPLGEVEAELSKFQYGFLLRDDHIINNVSTPTKMNTYLSVGLIPIYSNVICSFEEHIHLKNYGVKVKNESTIEMIAEQIITHNHDEINYDNYYHICKSSFDNYYDDSYNINKIEKDILSKMV